jgi:hypothetical protein
MHPDSDCDGLVMVGKIRRLSNQPNWFHLKINPESIGIVETIQRSDSVLVLRYRLLDRVSRRSPLGASPGVTHALILYLFSSRHHIRFWVLLSESRLEGGVNRANLKFINLSTTTSQVSVRNINESEREGAKQIVSK